VSRDLVIVSRESFQVDLYGSFFVYRGIQCGMTEPNKAKQQEELDTLRVSFDVSYTLFAARVLESQLILV
jgi:hypothetical protein